MCDAFWGKLPVAHEKERKVQVNKGINENQLESGF